MKHINLRLPDDLHERVRAAANRDRRSINGWIIVQIEQTLEQQQPSYQERRRP